MALLRGYVSGVEREVDRMELWQQKERQNKYSLQSPSQTTRSEWLLSIKKLTYFQVCLWYAEIQRLKSFELFGDKFIITTCRYNNKINVVIMTYDKTAVCVYRNHSITSVGSYILDHSHGCFIFVSHAILQNGWIERYKEIKNFIIAGVLFFQLNYLLSK